MNLQTEAWTPAATAGIGFSRNRDGQDWAAILKDEARPRRHRSPIQTPRTKAVRDALLAVLTVRHHRHRRISPLPQGMLLALGSRCPRARIADSVPQ
jgi:hypothetical protein